MLDADRCTKVEERTAAKRLRMKELLHGEQGDKELSDKKLKRKNYIVEIRRVCIWGAVSEA